jgi:hypothetical protein
MSHSNLFTPSRVLAATTLCILIALGGCATLSESQCVASDWKTVGYRDGMAGTQSSQLLRHQNACVKHGVVPDREEYLAGWEDGVRQYCLPENGFSAGEKGQAYQNVCPTELQPSFYAAYQEGRQLFTAQSEINNLNRLVTQKENRLKQIDKEISAAEASLIEDGHTPAQRMALLDSSRALAQEQGELQAEISEHKVDAALKTERLQQLRQTLAYAY